MNVESSFTIDGKVVVKTKMKIGEYEIYKTDDSDLSYTFLYFVDKNRKVLSSMEIEAGMGQGMGYVSDIRTSEYS
ncbi:hypothetical protein S14_180 [Shewanella sp. phage 1/4]|uniref:hypothetical protein n=1 Tax=Shewanella phage 1/4 TaxID=1458859 RepID=UPI0004F6C3DB|nr:hypothetical protein S14_180 [Shewanella sp. phage 1/4]AHK11289.1 hypothetical protein S14_180 [Shewanella sp. phage 1/4]